MAIEDKDKPIGRSRNAIVQTLIEDEVFILDGDFYHVVSGEVVVYANGSIDKRLGEIAEIGPERVITMIAQHKHILNIDELK